MNDSSTVSLDPIRAMLQRARDAGTKWPRIRLAAPGGRTIVMSLAGIKARFPGSVNVTNEKRYEDSTWYGRIVAGRLRAGNLAFNGLHACLVGFVSDPERAAAAFTEAQRGRCCFCGTKIKKGSYGPTCAKKYGMPYTK